MALPKDRTIIASDVNHRDGIGVAIYRNDELVVEIFRDDTKLMRTVTIFQKDIALELLEESIDIFKKEIPWDFINYDELKEE
jgi:predicted glutamine amidotransferase